MAKVRDSQFELLRIVAQWLIVFYHLFYDYTVGLQNEHPIYAGIQIPIHIGVVLFVMISGFYGIKPSVKGFGKLCSYVIVYWIPLAILIDIHNNLGLIATVKDFLIVSYPRYWFFRCYLFLFLFSPIINKYLNNITSLQRLYLLCILTFMSVWVGTSMGDLALGGGKNLTNFMLLYVIGNTLAEYKYKWEKISLFKLCLAFLVTNTSLVSLYCMFHDSILGTIIMQLAYPYCSPIILINSILFFMIFGKFRLQSKWVNFVALSCFGVYLIHYHRYIWPLIGIGADWCIDKTSNIPYLLIPMFALYATAIYATCTLIDVMMSPLWRYLYSKFIIIDNFINERYIKK